MTALSDTRPVARKEHVCEECNRTIKIGEQYHRYAGIWEGDFFTNVACLHCSAARKVFVVYCDDYWENYYGGLSELLGECWREHDDPITLGRLLVGVRSKWVYRSGNPMPIPEAAP